MDKRVQAGSFSKEALSKLSRVAECPLPARFVPEQGGEGQTLAVLSSIFVVLRLYHENLRAEFAQPFVTLPYHVRTKCQRAADPRSRFAR